MNSEPSNNPDFQVIAKFFFTQSKRSRKRVAAALILLIATVSVFSGSIIVTEYLKNSPKQIMFSVTSFNKHPSIEKTLENRMANILSTSDNNESNFSIEDFSTFADYYLRIKDRENEKKKFSFSDLIPFISRTILASGAVAFIVMLIQVSIMFMKYHTRLAELYETQANIILATEADMDKATEALKVFSPNSIEIGKTPTTLYEKALDTIQEVAKSKF